MFIIDIETMLIAAKNVDRRFRANFFNFERLIILVSGVKHSSYLS
jgi:hypothetical protein